MRESFFNRYKWKISGLTTAILAPLLIFGLQEFWQGKNSYDNKYIEESVRLDIAGTGDLRKRLAKLESEREMSFPKEKIESCFVPGVKELAAGKRCLQNNEKKKAKQNLEKAINYFKCAVEAFPCYETFYNLAAAYNEYPDYDKSQEIFQKAVQNDPSQPGAYNGLGIMYMKNSSYYQAKQYLQQALGKAGQLINQRAKMFWQGEALTNLGFVGWNNGQLDEALNYYQQALVVYRKTGDRWGEVKVLGNLGVIYQARGQLDEALKNYRQTLKIDREIGNKPGEANDLINLGNIYYSKNQLDEALKHYQPAIGICRKMGKELKESQLLSSLGVIYQAKGQLDEALKYQKEALTIDRKIKNQLGEANTLGNMGVVFQDKGQLDEALNYHQQALILNQVTRNKLGEANDLTNIGNVFRAKGKLNMAREYYKTARSYFERIGAKSSVDMVDRYLAKLEGL